MRNPIEIFLIIIMCAIITFGLRALPFAVFRGKRKMPVWLEQLGKALPPLIMAVLIVYCLRDITTDPKTAYWNRADDRRVSNCNKL